MANVIPPESSRKIYQHVGSFVCPYFLTAVAAAAATTALVIGILALLHSYDILNCGSIGCIPMEGSYTLLAGGSVLLVAVAIALKMIHDCKDKLIKPLKALYNPQWYPAKAPPSTYTTYHDTVYVTKSDGVQEVHQFSKMDELQAYTSALEKEKTQFCSKLEMETGASVQFFVDNLDERNWLDSFVMFIKDFTPWKKAFEKMPHQKDSASFYTLGYTSIFEPLALKEPRIYCVLRATASGEKFIYLFMQQKRANLVYDSMKGIE